MIYKAELHNCTLVIDTDRIREIYLNHKNLCIAPTSNIERTKIIAILDERGYKWDNSKDCFGKAPIDSSFPIVIDAEKKGYRTLWTTTSAAAAASGKTIGTEKEFCELFLGEAGITNGNGSD